MDDTRGLLGHGVRGGRGGGSCTSQTQLVRVADAVEGIDVRRHLGDGTNVRNGWLTAAADAEERPGSRLRRGSFRFLRN